MTVCGNYRRPAGVMGGPCLNCGASQPEHVDVPQARCTTSGQPLADDHRELDPVTGQQKDYVVLCADERAKGFVRPVRDTYRHLPCGTTTTMGRSLAETYARDPGFYSGTFCVTCRSHFPLIEFVWGDGTQVGS